MVPKAIGACNLDQASRGLATLEHFVMFSSIVASAGNEGKLLIAFKSVLLRGIVLLT